MPEETPPRVAEAADGGFSVEYRGRGLYSRVAPREGPERIVRALRPLPDTVYIVPSPLLGYGLASLLERLPASSAVLALEADPALADLARSRLPPEISGHPRFRLLEDPSRASRAIRSLGTFRRAVEVRLSAGRSLYPEAYDAALREVDAELERYWRNRVTLVRMGRLWVRNIFRNLARLPSVPVREASAWEGSVVVCGAGPSLDRTAPWLAAERVRLRILACDTALGPLVLRGIRPDAVVCLEGQVHNLKDFLPAAGSEIPVFADLSSHPSVFRAVRGPKFLTLTDFEPLNLLDRLGNLPLPLLRIPPLGSVGVLAVHLARRLTKGPILLTGLDFSFPPGSTHAKGSPALQAESLLEDRLYKARSQWASSWPRHTRIPGPSGSGGAGAVMGLYASLLSEETRGDPRVFDLRDSGLPLGLRKLGLPEASRLIEASATGNPPSGPLPSGRAVPPEELRTAADVFLDGEAARVEYLLAALAGSGDLAARVAECDWIYSWFPDEGRVRELSGDVRNRLLAEALDWKRRIREARAGLEEA